MVWKSVCFSGKTSVVVSVGGTRPLLTNAVSADRRFNAREASLECLIYISGRPGFDYKEVGNAEDPEDAYFEKEVDDSIHHV